MQIEGYHLLSPPPLYPQRLSHDFPAPVNRTRGSSRETGEQYRDRQWSPAGNGTDEVGDRQSFFQSQEKADRHQKEGTKQLLSRGGAGGAKTKVRVRHQVLRVTDAKKG